MKTLVIKNNHTSQLETVPKLAYFSSASQGGELVTHNYSRTRFNLFFRLAYPVISTPALPIIISALIFSGM